MKSVTIPDSVTSIGNHAFSGCRSLESVAIPDSVTSIGEGAFSDCISLESVTIPDSVTSIGVEAFRFCRTLKSVTIPNSVTSIGDGAFSDCISLESVIIPDSVTSIGVEAFRFCRTLKSVTIPNSVTSIGNNAFASCSSLEKVLFAGNSPQIGNGIFEGNKRLEVYFTGKATGFRRPKWAQPTGILRKGPEIVVLQSKVNFFDYGFTTVWNPLNEGGAEYNFGASPVGKIRQIKKFMVRNDGTRKLGPLKIIKGGPNKADFSATFSSKQLEAGEFARLTLKFKPSAKGGTRRKATIRIISNDKDERTFDIKVLGKVQRKTKKQ